MRFNVYKNIFEEIDVKPEKLAVVGSNGELTWDEFYKRVQIAVKLISNLKIPAGHPIIIFGHKEVNYMVWEVACTISDTPFIPFDSIYPLKRLNTIIEETQSQVLVNLSNQKIKAQNAIEISDTFEVIENQPANFESSVYGDSTDPLMYMIFTSGSTGTPKGVMVNHSNYCELIRWMESDYGFSSSDVFMNQAVFSFDLSLFDCFFCFACWWHIINY